MTSGDPWSVSAAGTRHRELLASGRACDVFVIDAATVLRTERAGRSLEHEADVMRYVHSLGFPCPAVRHASGADMVIERLDGPTLTVSLLADPTPARLGEGAALLAGLHDRLHRLPSMPGSTGALLHLDLHPDNVIVTADGPVVIDWTNSEHGDPELDVATTWVILEPFARAEPLVAAFVDAFLHQVGRDTAIRGLAEAGRRRLADRNVTPDERGVIRLLLAEHGISPAR